MFVKLGGKFLKVAGSFAKSLACCCGGDTGNKWYCLTSSDGSYRCAQDYDISQDQVLSEHGSESECNQQCGQGNVWCYYDDAIGYFCTDYWDGDGALSGPYTSTIECNANCKQMYFCVDKGSGGGETQYECVLQDPDEDYLSGPYGSKNACEYSCGDSFYCVSKSINTDEYEYECVQSNEGEPDNTVSGPYQSSTTCEEYCKACEEVELPDQKDCPDCVDAACEYMTAGGLDGGEWGTCCAGLIETWRYCDGEWELIMPCHPEGEKTAGTPACEVYPENLDFPDDPVEGQIYSVECDRVLGFDPADYPDCVSCNYTCSLIDGAYECELDTSGPHKTLQECIDNCPEKWSCISTDECVQKPDGKYAEKSECIEAAPVDCGAVEGSCCQYNASMDRYTCIENIYENLCSEPGDVFTPGGFCGGINSCPDTSGVACVHECVIVSGATAGSYEDAELLLDDECMFNEGRPCRELGFRYIRDQCVPIGDNDFICTVGLACCSGYRPQGLSYECKPAGSDGQSSSLTCVEYENRFAAEQDSAYGFVCDDPDETGQCTNWIRGGDCSSQPCDDVINRSISFAPPP
jgi:hypothetical protein